ncbi:hypothetical protein G8C92_09290 [Paenibacillus donghaensis]|uniref:hypothetical protein n=1 Tax=Paenibacillus donghaensis TaxID=414771 RepID=UPI001883EF89|nr:hypothetical protein [Paenibacillus donghaensis]MBE9914223.1 hypothetical protein [Paenibacillus donghaensis]
MGPVGAVVYMVLVLFFLKYIKHRISKSKALADYLLIKEILKIDLYGINEREPIIIIFLDYESNVYGELDTLISKGNAKFIIVFRAPIWLFRLKKLIWKQHIVLDGNQYSSMPKDGIVQMFKGGKLRHYSKPQEFLEYYNSKIQFHRHFDK